MPTLSFYGVRRTLASEADESLRTPPPSKSRWAQEHRTQASEWTQNLDSVPWTCRDSRCFSAPCCAQNFSPLVSTVFHVFDLYPTIYPLNSPLTGQDIRVWKFHKSWSMFITSPSSKPKQLRLSNPPSSWPWNTLTVCLVPWASALNSADLAPDGPSRSLGWTAHRALPCVQSSLQTSSQEKSRCVCSYGGAVRCCTLDKAEIHWAPPWTQLGWIRECFSWNRPQTSLFCC